MTDNLKVVASIGKGRPPGYQWNVLVLDQAHNEAQAILMPIQYVHVREQVRSLARDVDPSHSVLLDVDAIEDFFELREKGGPLGKINLRVFFGLDTRKSGRGKRHAIVVLGVVKKENNGATPVVTKTCMACRWRRYMLAYP
jgi:hypothetical protein